MSSDTESRFSHLLQPIRDLADNWNIDIARELEDYLGELEKITFSFDGVSSSLNFAEAALVIQGSAVVYSKKVEYLYALLYQTLDFLVDKKQKKSQQDATDTNNEAEEEPDFLSLDDDLEEGKGIDLVEGESAPIRGRSSAAHISIAMSLAAEIPEPGNPDSNDGNSNGAKKRENFQMNTCMVHSSGALVFDAMASLADDFLLRPSSAGMPSRRESFVNNNDISVTNDLNTNNTTQNNETNGADFSSSVGGFDLGGGAMSDDEDNGDAEVRDGEEGEEEVGRSSIFGQFAAERKQNELARKAGEGVRVRSAGTEGGKREKPKKRIVDLWAMLDPHEEVGSIKPYKKGKPYRIRTAAKPAKDNGDAVVPILSIAETPHFFRGVRGPDFSEFTYLYNMDMKRRKEAKKKDKYEFTFEDTVFAAAEAEEEEEDIQYRPELSAHFNGATPEVEVEPEEAGLDGGAADDDDDDVDVGDFGMLDQDDSGVGTETQTYEDFYAQRVEQFMSEAAQYAQESNLSKRVNEWKSKLAPVLDEQESHPSFDMIEYGDSLINTLKVEYEGKPGVHFDEEGDVETQSDLIIPFAKLTVGVERYEVARRFAAVLQLVNNENVKVVTNHEIDSLGFHLLSVRPKYDIENYLAPSLNPSSTTTTSSSSSSSSSSSQTKKSADLAGKKKTKRGRPSKDEKAKKDGKKGKKNAESEEEIEEESEETKEKESEDETGKGKETTGKGKSTKHDDKENVPNGKKEKRKRKERTFYEPEEEVLKGPRTKMFEVAV